MSRGFKHKSKKHPNKFGLYVPTESQAIVVQAKEIMEREGESLSQKFVKFCEDYVRLHSDGNPQLLMTKYTQPQLIQKTCEYPGCTNKAEWLDHSKPPGKPKVYYCQRHHEHALENRLLKASKRL